MLVHRLFFYFYRSLIVVLFAELMRGVFSAALMMMIKEKINGGVANRAVLYDAVSVRELPDPVTIVATAPT